MRNLKPQICATVRTAALLAAGSLALARPITLAAQTATGAAVIGIRAFDRMPKPEELAKFTQYRTMPDGFLAQELYGRLTTADSFRSVQLFGNSLGQKDQRLALRFNDPGMADLQITWDRAPHVYSTNARFLGTESSPGVYTLPTPRPDTATLNASGFVAPIRQQWDPVNVAFTFTPAPAWDLKVDYTRIGKSGQRPMGMAFGGSGNNAREIPEPIDQTMHDFRISQAFTGARFQLMVSYGYSVFNNAIPSVTSDNPNVTVDGLNTFSSRGRTALAPDNRAQTFSATGSIALPRRTHVTGAVSYGWWTQNAPFIAPTINSANADSLTRAGVTFPTSLDGRVHTSMANFSVNSRPLDRLNINARYRSYDYKDLTAEMTVPVLVINDRSISAGATGDLLPWNRRSAEASASLRLQQYVTVTGGYAWDRMHRDTAVRNVANVSERTPRISVDFTGLSFADLRVSYSHSTRRGDGYHQVDSPENPDSRRFDEADRNRNRMSLFADIMPVDQVTLSLTYEFGHDTFPSSAFGVQHDKNTAYGLDVSWNPIPRVSLSGGYEHEQNDNQMRARYRTGSTDATLNNATWQWVATNLDTSTTWYATASAVVVPARIEAGGTYQISKSSFRMMANNPVAPTGGTTSQNTAATAADFPLATQELRPFTVYVRYILTPDWSLTASYQGEKFTQYDFRTTGLAPATGAQIFLGNDLLPYDARFFTVTVNFRPSLLKHMRAAM